MRSQRLTAFAMAALIMNTGILCIPVCDLYFLEIDSSRLYSDRNLQGNHFEATTGEEKCVVVFQIS